MTDYIMKEYETKLEHISPEEIERRSLEIISRELRGRVFPEGQSQVIKRVIHTTADFDFADLLVFSEGAVEQALKALREGCTIVTDTDMGKAGINKKSLKKIGGQVLCFMADEDVAARAKAEGATRASVSMEKAAGLGRDCIFAVGNAPTALLKLHELIGQGKVHPRLIIGVPVGFVNVVQSKERILALENVPYIVARGRKGGSSVAAAICNALIYQIDRER